MNKNISTDLGRGSVTRLLFRLAVPAITAQIINVLYNVVDRIYIGHIENIGSDALAGVGITFPLIMLVSAFASLISMGGAPRASIKLGENNHEDAERILGNCTTALFIISVVLTGFLLIFGRDLLLQFGASENTIQYSWDYMKIYSIGTIFVQIALGLNMFITTQGFAKTSMLTVLIGAVTNIILDPIFIFGLNLGVKGAALATIISQAISAIWVFAFLLGKKTTLKIKVKHLKIKFSTLLPCLALGLSPFIMQATESVLNICFNYQLSNFGGDIAVSTMAILASIMQFSMLPVQGLTQGAQPIISFNFGAKNGERVSKAFKILLISCLSYSMLIWLICMIVPNAFASIFTSDQQLIDNATSAIRVYMAASGIFGAQLACQQTFIAVGNAKSSLFLAVLRKIILLIPLIFILPTFISDKVFAVYLAEPVADTIAVITTVTMFTIYFKKTIRSLNAEKLLIKNNQ